MNIRIGRVKGKSIPPKIVIPGSRSEVRNPEVRSVGIGSKHLFCLPFVAYNSLPISGFRASLRDAGMTGVGGFIHTPKTHPKMGTFDHRRDFALDYALAIRRNRDQIRTIILTLFALAGLRPHRSLPVGPDGRVQFTLPRSVFAMIMLVLRPAESCVRRLIVIAAHGLKPVASAGSGADIARLADLPPRGGDVRQDRGGRAGHRAFQLFDPLKHFDPEAIWDAEPVWESGFDLTPAYTSTLIDDDKPLDATHIGQRLNALMRALDNLPAQARRLIRWQQKRDAALKSLMLRCEQSEPRSTHTWSPRRLSPMRPGLPPGWRERKVHEIDDVLRECHGLAHDRLNSS